MSLTARDFSASPERGLVPALSDLALTILAAADESFTNNLMMVAALAYIQQMRDAIAPKPRGFTAIGVFLFFGAGMATFAATTLLRQGTPLDRLWALNPTAYNQLAPLGGIVVIVFLALAATLITAGIGWFRRRLWGWRLAVIIISTQVLAGCGKRLASRNISRFLFLLSSDLGFRVVVKGRLRRFRDVIRHTEAAGYCA
jgi:hypothetical protein